MKPDAKDISISNQRGRERYELALDGTPAAFVQYRADSGRVEFLHTEVLPQHEGQGLGQQLAQFALDDVRRQGLKAVPSCSFIASYIERNPQYRDLVQGAAR